MNDKGKVLGFSAVSRSGEISGDDGNRYRFEASEWQGNTQPEAGDVVNFVASGEMATSIYKVQFQTADPAPSSVTSPKSRIAAALLALFLGGLGIHKFYIGKGGAGAIMLIVSLFGSIFLFIPTLIISVIAFIEAIIYLVMSEEEFNEKYVIGDRAWF